MSQVWHKIRSFLASQVDINKDGWSQNKIRFIIVNVNALCSNIVVCFIIGEVLTVKSETPIYIWLISFKDNVPGFILNKVKTIHVYNTCWTDFSSLPNFLTYAKIVSCSDWV